MLRSLSGRSLSVLPDALSSIGATAVKPTVPQIQTCMVSDTSRSQFNTICSIRCSAECTVPCSTFDGSRADANPTLCGSVSPDAHNFAFITGAVTGAPTIDQIQSHIKANTLPIFRAPIDSGCTASCTDTLARLVNIRPCDEDFKAANGSMCKCTAIGDMPILAKDSTGKILRFVFTNVRYVPDFKYTLISVKQIWRDQGIKSLFADSGRLMFPDGNSVPYDPRFKLYAVTLISEPMLINSLGAVEKKKSKAESSHGNTCCVGFHNVKSTSHVARLPAAQASELLHRRCHMGVNKVRALPHVSGDAPKILGSAIPCTCVHCAAAQIRRAGHSGAMDTPDPEPGILHVDLKGPFPLICDRKISLRRVLHR